MRLVLPFTLLVSGFLDPRPLIAGPVNFKFSLLQLPGTYHIVSDINDSGQTIGFYSDASSGHGFVDTNGIITPLDFPGAPPNNTDPLGINDSGQVVGAFYSSAWHAFLYANGGFTTIPLSDPSYVSANDINDKGDIVGSVGSQGFLYSNGAMKIIGYPGSLATSLSGINDAGQIVGTYFDSVGQHGFLYSNGKFTTIDFPGSAGSTLADRINDSGEIIGYAPEKGFLYSNGIFSTIEYPNPDTSYTEVTGLNDAGQIVGNYSVQNTLATQPFFASPIPEPGPLTLVVTALAAHVRIRRRYRRRSGIDHTRRGSCSPLCCRTDQMDPATI